MFQTDIHLVIEIQKTGHRSWTDLTDKIREKRLIPIENSFIYISHDFFHWEFSIFSRHSSCYGDLFSNFHFGLKLEIILLHQKTYLC